MAIHTSIRSMLCESLNEYIHVSEYCVNFVKSDGGCLGYPAALVMFSIIDSIGSYNDIAVRIDGKEKKIKADIVKTHFYILNSEYYNQNLSEHQITKIYLMFRNTLTHNAAIVPGVLLKKIESDERAFIDYGDTFVVNVTGLLKLNKLAVDKFLTDPLSVTGSTQEQSIRKKGLKN